MKLCSPHRKGVVPGNGPFYSAGCPVCERKLAQGLVVATDPSTPFSLREKSPQWRAYGKRGTNAR